MQRPITSGKPFRMPNGRIKAPDFPMLDLDFMEDELPADPQMGAQLAADYNSARAPEQGQRIPIPVEEGENQIRNSVEANGSHEPFVSFGEREAPGRFRSRTMSIRTTDNYSSMIQARNAARQRVANGSQPQPDSGSEPEQEPEPEPEPRQRSRSHFLRPPQPANREPQIQANQVVLLPPQPLPVPQIPQVVLPQMAQPRLLQPPQQSHVYPVSRVQQQYEDLQKILRPGQVHLVQTFRLSLPGPQAGMPQREQPTVPRPQGHLGAAQQSPNLPQEQPLPPPPRQQTLNISQIIPPHAQPPLPTPQKPLNSQTGKPQSLDPSKNPLMAMHQAMPNAQDTYHREIAYRLDPDGRPSNSGSKILYMDPKPQAPPRTTTTFVVRMCRIAGKPSALSTIPPPIPKLPSKPKSHQNDTYTQPAMVVAKSDKVLWNAICATNERTLDYLSQVIKLY